MALSIRNAEAITACDEFVDACDTGSTQPNPVLVIYDGTPPTLVEDALSGNNILAELAMSNPAFGAAADDNPGGKATANAISDDTSANNTGTATFFRIFDRQATALARIQGAIRATGDPDNGEELVLNSTAIQSGALVEITSLTATMPEG